MTKGLLWNVTVYEKFKGHYTKWGVYTVIASDELEARKKALVLAAEEMKEHGAEGEIAYCEIVRAGRLDA